MLWIAPDDRPMALSVAEALTPFVERRIWKECGASGRCRRGSVWLVIEGDPGTVNSGETLFHTVE